MDDSVIQSMAKWPHVPDCYGWLHLNAQGQWLMGETLAAGAAQPPSVVVHEGLQGFMNRNYVCPFPISAPISTPIIVPISAPVTAHGFTKIGHHAVSHTHAGAWALQNGPQRVWVTLALAPLIVQVHLGKFTAHTGMALDVQSFVLASDGVVYCKTAQGVGAIASRSMETFAQGVTALAEGLAWQANTDSPPLAMTRCEAACVEGTLGFARNVWP